MKIPEKKKKKKKKQKKDAKKLGNPEEMSIIRCKI